MDQSGWTIRGPAHKQRFLEYNGEGSTNETESDKQPSAPDSGPVLQDLKRGLFESVQYSRFLEQICSLGMPLGHRGRIRRFRPGLDYTVAHYGILTREAVLDATLCFAAGNGDQCRVDEATGEVMATDDDAMWESGDCGGFECYIAADDDEDDDDDDGENGGDANGEDTTTASGTAKGKAKMKEAADEYNDDDDTELLSVSPSNNTLSLVYRDPGTMRFVKYVGCQAPSSRWDISMEYEVPHDEDDNDENGDDMEAPPEQND